MHGKSVGDQETTAGKRVNEQCGIGYEKKDSCSINIRLALATAARYASVACVRGFSSNSVMWKSTALPQVCEWFSVNIAFFVTEEGWFICSHTDVNKNCQQFIIIPQQQLFPSYTSYKEHALIMNETLTK